MGKRFGAITIVLLPLVTVLACESPLEQDVDTNRSIVSKSNSPPATGMDRQLLELGKLIDGGFGGIFVEDGRFVVRIRDLSKKDAAREQVSSILSASSSTVSVVSADYTFDQLHRWHVAVTDIHSIPGIAYTDSDERENRLVVGLASASARPAAEDFLKSKGVPTGAVLFNVVGPRTTELSLPSHQNLQAKVRPVPGGMQIDGDQTPCTLGVNVDHYVHGRSFFTASHCGQRASSDVGPYYQPTDGSGKRIGMEVMDPVPVTGSIQDVYGNYYSCPTGYGCRWSDVSLVAYDDSVSSEAGKVARPSQLGGSAPFPVSHSTPRFHLDPGVFCWMGVTGCNFSGQGVRKVGRSTGWTEGTITSTCVNTNAGGAMPLHFKCQTIASYASAIGDSGSPVFSTSHDGEYRHGFRGIHWAADGAGRWFSSFEVIRQEFGNTDWLNHFGIEVHTLEAGPGPPLTASITGPNEVPDSGWCTWQGFGSGGSGQYTYSWSGVLSGSGPTISGTVGSAGTLYLTVNDGTQNAYDQMYISIDPWAECLE